MHRLACLLVFILSAAPGVAQTGTADIYVIDVEGGNATLFVAPSGESLLMDTGNGGARAARDVGRIMAAVQDAGLSQIDHLITTHWHGDHFGGMAELASRIPIRNFIDHGPSVQSNANTDEFLEETYPELYREADHTVVTPGARIPMAGVDVTVLASAGEVLGQSSVGELIRIAPSSRRGPKTWERTHSRSESWRRSASSGSSIWGI